MFNSFHKELLRKFILKRPFVSSLKMFSFLVEEKPTASLPQMVPNIAGLVCGPLFL
jgi:hypothetical protein